MTTTPKRMGGNGLRKGQARTVVIGARAPSVQEQFSVRRGSLDDAAPIAVLATHVFVHTYAERGVRRHVAREVLTGYSEASFAARLAAREFLLAEVDDHLVGFLERHAAGACPVRGAEGFGQVALLYVHPRFHGRGVGYGLLARAEAEAVAEGLPGLWLTAWEGNGAARAFYGRQGYRLLGSRDETIEGQTYTNRVLGKALAAPGLAPSVV